jgi:carbonic anhydrase/acetyltransferase-like protein (isoleucine patch superfamily)
MVKSFNGKTPRIAGSAFISKTAYIIGDVEIGENCVVMPGAVIRADLGKITIGDNTIVEDNCVIHSGSLDGFEDIVIGENVVIGHGAINHARKIGNNVLIGMNATILHDAEIGDFCIIAAGALVGQGAKIPDRSFVAGVPGKVKKEVSQEQLLWTQLGSIAYIELAKQYKKEGL